MVEKFSNAVKSNLTKTYYIIRSAWKTFRFLSTFFRLYVCVCMWVWFRHVCLDRQLFYAWYLLILKNVAACFACFFATISLIAFTEPFCHNFFMVFWYIFFSSIFQNSLTIANDPGTSDDSGRASERLTTSSVAPRDADSSRDRLSDVSITFHYLNGRNVSIALRRQKNHRCSTKIPWKTNKVSIHFSTV